MKLTAILFHLLLFVTIAVGGTQKKPLDIEAYKLWRYVEDPKMSDDGKWITYHYKYTDIPEDKNNVPKSYLYSTVTGRTYEFLNVKQIHFWDNGKRIKYTVTHPLQDTISTVQDSIFLMSLKNMQKKYWDRPYACNTSARNNIITSLYSIGKTEQHKDIKRLIILDIETLDSIVIDSIVNYKLLDNYKSIIYIKEKNGYKALYAGPIKGVQKAIYDHPKTYPVTFSINKDSKKGILSVATDSSYLKNPDLLYRFSLVDRSCHLLLDTKKVTIEDKYQVKGKLYQPFNQDKYIFVDVEAQPEATKKIKTRGDKSCNLELWTWNEEYAQSRRNGIIRKSSPPKYVYHTDHQNCILIAPEGMDQMIKPDCDEYEYVLVGNQKAYRKAFEWRGDIATDWYLVNLHTGNRKLIYRDFLTTPEWSPDGKFALFYDAKEKTWFKLNPTTGTLTDISSAIGYPVYNEDHDRPEPPQPNKIAGWTNGGKQVILYDRYDLWVIDLTGEKVPYSLTGGWGRKNNTILRLIRNFNSSKFLDLKKDIMLKAVKEESLDQGIYFRSPNGKIKKIIEGAYNLSINQVTGCGKYCMFTRESYSESKEIWWSKGNFTQPIKVTDCNPQQKDYNWGSVQLVEWTNFEGKRNKGLLYLPENYEPSKPYPMIVSFYETITYKYHTYPTPGLTKAMINAISYVSNGYAVFMPDIHFTVGMPGESCYNAVVSGTQMLIDRGIADKDKIGIQGHSWSGYLVTYLITRTNLFACANAAAPVSNMVSAYTGIRSSSGLPRMFMYEAGQSRIGKTLWEDPELYIKNSPIFKADKIVTPLLITHCDKDGSVPYYEGLNLFLAMRRLQKPAWLLNYKGEGHVLTKRVTAIDFTIRLKQFFDYYLKNTPSPRWMKEGFKAGEQEFDPKYDYVK